LWITGETRYRARRDGLQWWLLGDASWLHNYIRGGGRRNSVDVELWCLVILLDLLVLRLNVHLVLELCAIRPQVGCTASTGAEIQLNVEAAHTDRPVTLGAEMELVLNLAPGFL